jgi:hypothetical protein
MGQGRDEIEALTYHEVVEVLTMADMEEQDRRHFLLSTKSDDPYKTYSEIREGVEKALTPQAEVDDEPPEIASWLRQS